MIIGSDIQALQSPSRDRGIGRYTKSLLESMLKLDSKNTYKFFINDNLEKKIHSKLITNNELIHISYNDKTDPSNLLGNDLLQLYKYNTSNLDFFLLPSTFEGHPINPGTINRFYNRLNSFLGVIVYDFIPLYFPQHYMRNPVIREVIYRQLKILYYADVLFAISESTRLDAINLLGINPKKIHAIYGGITDAFHKLNNLSESKIQQIKQKYKIKEKFILYVGGIDLRKNIETSILGFAKIQKTLLNNTSYVIVCHISDTDKERLQKLAKFSGVEDNMIFTGFIPDVELNILYNCCETFVFPSLMEGLGIPVLEAMACGCPVITGDNSSLTELVNNDEFMFDSRDQQSIADAITKMLTDESLREKSRNNSLKQIKNFSWEKSAQKVLDTIKLNKNEIELKKSTSILKKPKIAFFSPMPPKMSGISYYSTHLLRFLSKYWEIDVFLTDGYYCDDEFLTTNLNFYSYTNFENLHKLKKYDSIVYQMGNSDHHVYIYDLIQKYPGVVVLHDIYLSNLMHWMFAMNQPNLDRFYEEMIYCHDELGEKYVDKLKKHEISEEKVILELLMNKRVLDNATEIIVHSEWDKQKIIESSPKFSNIINVANQFAPIRIIPSHTKNTLKRKLGFSKNDFIICSFGFVANTKKIDSVIENLKKFLVKTPNAKYILVGDAGFAGPYGQKIKKLVTSEKLTDKIIFTDFVTHEEYKKYLDICDVCISLRTKTRAGTSASVSNALGSGIPTIISDEGPFSVFPENVVIKVKPEEEKELGNILDDLYCNAEHRNSLSKNAYEYAQTVLSVDEIVKTYVSTVDKIINKHESKS